MFDLANDSGLFRSRDFLEHDNWVLDGNVFRNEDQACLPLYEGRMIDLYDHRCASVGVNEEATYRSNTTETTSSEDSQSPINKCLPRHWVDQKHVGDALPADYRFKWFIGFRDVTSAISERTIRISLLPAYAAGHKVPLLLLSHDPKTIALFAASLSSFAADYLVRQKLGGLSLTFFIVNQLPVIPPETYGQGFIWVNDPNSDVQNQLNLRDWLLPRVLGLNYTAWDLEAFAADCGWSGPPFRWDEERRFLLRCELDAAFFHLYLGPAPEWQQQPEALTRAFPTPRHAVSYIMDTFPIVKRKDETKHGHYRTKETILQIYDALSESMQSGHCHQTLLNPPPADPACCHPAKSP